MSQEKEKKQFQGAGVEGQQPHKRRVRYKVSIRKNLKKNIRNCNRKYCGHHPACNRKRKYSGWHAYFHYGNKLDFLEIKPGQTGFDATLGYGGQYKCPCWNA